MEVAIGNNNTPPFQREVREWQHIDPTTGALLTGRLEADRWVNGPMNTYGKMVSQNLSTPDGTQHTQRKQLEILQARSSSGAAMQVVRAQTVQTSSSRWSSSTSYNTNMTSNNKYHMNHNNKPLTSSPAAISLKSLMHQPTASSLSPLATPSSHVHQLHKTVDLLQQSMDHSTHKLSHLHHDKNNNVGALAKHMDFHKLYSNFNERETISNPSDSFSSRGKSASIEDLSNFDDSNFDDDVEPTEWKRVSKIRRSLQFPKTSTSPKIYTRPPDLPENSVSVLKIKEELENGRRLNTAMRNNHVDFAALDSILNTIANVTDPKPEPRASKKASFITADSLKEIRSRLRKLSNESLYKDDMSPTSEGPDEEEKWSTNKIFVSPQKTTSSPGQQINSNSLESRNRSKEKELNSDDWHTRRKSYGFEKMFQPSETFGRMESSTDSGIGRSSDLSSNWSPTIDNSQRGTIITFGEKPKPPVATSITLFNGSHEIKPVSLDDLKRHSIAVDETRFMNEQLRRAIERKTSMVHLNGTYDETYSSSQEGILDDNKKGKKVEFCKTEIHFAAESGRVKIVETDGKPPPTNNFRRRRRSSGSSVTSSYLGAINSGVPVTHFGDVEKKPVDGENSWENTVTTSIGTILQDMQDEADGQSDDSSLRGILKNKPVKPKPYHLGENLDNSESLWGVRLKHVANEHSLWRSSVAESDIEAELNVSEPEALPELNRTNVIDRIKTTEDHSLKTPSPSISYSTKVHVSSHSPAFSWQSKDFAAAADAKATKIQIDLVNKPKPLNLCDELKSTSLIIKTMRSANQFDEAMKKLDSYNALNKFNDPPEMRTSAFRLVQQSNHIAKSNSANSIRDKLRVLPPKYASSLDGDRDKLFTKHQTDSEIIQDDFDVLNEILEENKRISLNLMATSISKSNMESDKRRLSSFKDFVTQNSPSIPQQIETKYELPVAAPRIKKLSSSSVLTQLSQLKRLYEANDDSDDSYKADEEVKLYLGNLSANEEKSSELSGSWSRVKAKRNVYKQSFQLHKDEHNLLDDYKWSSKKAIKQEDVGKVDSNHSNLISLTLESPTNSLKKSTPVAQPRVNVSAKVSSFEETPMSLSRNNSLIRKKEEALKISSGTRQLRDHELSYFGVSFGSKSSHVVTSRTSTPNTSTSAQPASKPVTANLASLSYNGQQNGTPSFSSTFLSTSNSSPTKTIIMSNATKTNMTNQSPTTNSNSNRWQLSNDKPDLIKYSQKIDRSNEKAAKKQQKQETAKEVISEPIYQNLGKPAKYNRMLDLDRDEQILSDLTRAADEIMNTCQEMIDAEHEENLRKSLKNHTLLDTITEGKQSRRASDDMQIQKIQMKSKGVQVSRSFEDSLRRYHRVPARTSSASSLESIPQNSVKTPSSAPNASKKPLTNGHSESTTSSTKSSIRRRASGSDSSKRVQRVCSRDRMQHSNASSSEDLPNSSVETPRRPRRTKVVKVESTKIEQKTVNKTPTRSVSDRSSSRRVQRTDGSIRSCKVESTKSRSSKSHAVSSPNTSSSVAPASTTPTTTPSRRSRQNM